MKKKLSAKHIPLFKKEVLYQVKLGLDKFESANVHWDSYSGIVMVVRARRNKHKRRVKVE